MHSRHRDPPFLLIKANGQDPFEVRAGELELRDSLSSQAAGSHDKIPCYHDVAAAVLDEAVFEQPAPSTATISCGPISVCEARGMNDRIADNGTDEPKAALNMYMIRPPAKLQLSHHPAGIPSRNHPWS